MWRGSRKELSGCFGWLVSGVCFAFYSGASWQLFNKNTKTFLKRPDPSSQQPCYQVPVILIPCRYRTGSTLPEHEVVNCLLSNLVSNMTSFCTHGAAKPSVTGVSQFPHWKL